MSHATPTLTPTPTETFANPAYDGMRAAMYAAEHITDRYEYDNDCANFVSKALATGFSQDHIGSWFPGSTEWIRANELYDFLKNDLLYPTIDFTNYQETGYTGEGYGYVRRKQRWENLMTANRNRIQSGDLVFYHDVRWFSSWTHVAIIIGWGAETNGSGIGADSSVQKPLVLEHSGPLDTLSPRSLDDTPNVWIGRVSLVLLSA